MCNEKTFSIRKCNNLDSECFITKNDWNYVLVSRLTDVFLFSQNTKKYVDLWQYDDSDVLMES